MNLQSSIWKENIPDDIGIFLELKTTSADIKEYIKKEEFKLRMKTVTDELINKDHEIKIYTNFFVDAEVLGQ